MSRVVGPVRTTPGSPKGSMAPTIDRYMAFLTELWTLSKKGGTFAFAPVTKNHKVNTNTYRVLIEDGLVAKKGTKYTWPGDKPTRKLATEVVEKLKAFQKKSAIVPASMPTLNELEKLTTEVEKSLKEFGDAAVNSFAAKLDKFVPAEDDQRTETDALNDEIEKSKIRFQELERKHNELFYLYSDLQNAHHELRAGLDNGDSALLDKMVNKHNEVHNGTSPSVMLVSRTAYYEIVNNAKTLDAAVNKLEADVATLNSNNHALVDHVASLEKVIAKMKEMGVLRLKTWLDPTWYLDLLDEVQNKKKK